ncbi:MAG: M48 family metalloprotease [Thermoplasmata archaeon]|nr:M48 family metalloprotease [Thermoplasmata archaeon]
MMIRFGLYVRLLLAMALMFAVLYALLSLVAYILGYGYPVVLAVLAFFIILLQYLMGPKMVEMGMRIRYITSDDNPRLYEMVEKLAAKAGVPMPRVGVASTEVPNAFAFGRSIRDGRVCVTKGLLKILNDEELEAVLGHEISHLKHRDMVIITMLSVIPLLSYMLLWNSMWSRRRDEGALLALVALLVYLISNLIVLYVSRVREYYADYGSVTLTGKPHALASALYRISISTTGVPRIKIKQVEGMKAFFATDPSTAIRDVRDLSKADLNLDGHIDEYELQQFASMAKASTAEKLMEIFSSHPNMVDRIKMLARMK